MREDDYPKEDLCGAKLGICMTQLEESIGSFTYSTGQCDVAFVLVQWRREIRLTSGE